MRSTTSTVKITLSQPNASLPMTLGNKYGAVVPAGYFDAPDAKTKLNQTSVGTGPFKLAEFKPNSNLTLVRQSRLLGEGRALSRPDQLRLDAQ